MFGPSIATLSILIRLVGLAMLSAGLPLAISNIYGHHFHSKNAIRLQMALVEDLQAAHSP